MPSPSLPSGETVIARCRQIALCTETPGTITRTFLCPAMHACHDLLRAWMEALAMDVSVDAAGNLRGVYAGLDPARGRILLGSHLDTVPNAGAFDGVLGVVLALALVESLAGRRLPFAIEIAGFSEEEGVRFGVPFLGSRALAGTLDEPLLALVDAHGINVRSALRDFGLDPAQLPQAVLHPHTFAYLEFHIEQGPVLESENEPLAVVEAIAGQSRLSFHFAGEASHAGTTPMTRRRDALAGAAAWITEVEQLACSTPGLVATVGRLEVKPGAGNVVPAEAVASLDVRHASDSVRARAVNELIASAHAKAHARHLQFDVTHKLDQSAVAMDSALIAALHQAIRKTGGCGLCMTSGAGHDAMILAPRVPSVMLFLRTPRGLSHHPDENVLASDIDLALAAGRHFLEGFPS